MPVYSLAIPFSALPALWSVLLLLGTWVACGFYTESEGHQLLVVTELPPGRFLRAKIVRAWAAWSVVVLLPLALAYAVRGPGSWLLPCAAIAACAVILAGAVVAKYAAYREGRPLGAFGAVVPLLLTAAVVFLPAAVVLLPRLWRVAEDNLERCLNAFDEGLRVSYGRREVIAGLDLVLPAGEVHGVVGPNGAGKTTLLEAIYGFVPTRGGTITLRGARPDARSTAYLPTENTFYPRMTCRAEERERDGIAAAVVVGLPAMPSRPPSSSAAYSVTSRIGSPSGTCFIATEFMQ